MSRIGMRIGRSVTVVCAVAVLVGGVGATAALGQGSSFSIQALLAALQSSVDALQQSVDALAAPDQVNFRFTPPAQFQSGNLRCVVVNVTNEERQVRIELIRALGLGAGFGVAVNTFTLPPGTADAISIVPGFIATGTLYCKFTVLNGTRADIRANLQINEITVLNTLGNTLLSVLAE